MIFSLSSNIITEDVRESHQVVLNVPASFRSFGYVSDFDIIINATSFDMDLTNSNKSFVLGFTDTTGNSGRYQLGYTTFYDLTFTQNEVSTFVYTQTRTINVENFDFTGIDTLTMFIDGDYQQLIDYDIFIDISDNYVNSVIYNNAYKEGKEDGVAIGKLEGESTALTESIIAIFDAPYKTFTNWLSFDFFGFNFASIILVIMTLVITMFALRKIK